MVANKIILTLNDVKKIAAGAESKAKCNDWPVAVAIVDEGGHLLCLQRLGQAQVGSLKVAIAKARATIVFCRPTKVWEEDVTEDCMRYLELPGTLPIITVKGKFVGAIGVSGVRSHQNAQIAQVGIDILL